MKYILNTGRYAVSFKITKSNGKLNREVKIELDRRRIFTDTGNIATTGITAIADEDFELLEKNDAFAKMLKDEKSGLRIISESEAVGKPDKQASELIAENKDLKKKIKELEKAQGNTDAEAMKQLADENATLKAQLEALKATQPATEDENKASEKTDEAKDEGF